MIHKFTSHRLCVEEIQAWLYHIWLLKCSSDFDPSIPTGAHFGIYFTMLDVYMHFIAIQQF